MARAVNRPFRVGSMTLIGAGLCSAGGAFAETPPASTVQAIEAAELFPLVPGENTFAVMDVLTQGQTVLYEPPVVLLPDSIVPDREWLASGRATIVNRETREVLHKGEYQHRIVPILPATRR